MRTLLSVEITSPLFEIKAENVTQREATKLVRDHKRIQNEAIRTLVNKAKVYSKDRPFGPRWYRRKFTDKEYEFINAYPMKATIKPA